ncbi:MAG TPA: amidase [Acidimicrobiia bacterium]|nr:amidase [Acidimicrobiia bacterium]
MAGATAFQRISAALERAHVSQGTVNAFISIDDDRALERATEIDERIAAGDDPGPLAGVPIGLKDLIDHEGRVTTSGSAFYRQIARTTATCVSRLEDAGAVIIGRTNLHEWAFGFNSENEHWGTVRNPWNLTNSAGGSSGGSAAAVAAGITPISIGTDTGGSVRVPAALCGTYGLKVTYGRIPLDGVFPLVPSIDTVGPLADSMENIDLSYRAMSRDDRAEPEPRPLRLGIPQPWYDDAPLQEDIAEEFQRTVASLRDLGHEVHPIEMPDVLPTSQLIDAIGEEVSAAHRQFREEGAPYGSAVEARIVVAESVTPEAALEARQWQQMIRSRFADAFATVDFLITPACAARSKTIGEEGIGDKNHRSVLSYFSAVVNHALHPALAMPIEDSGAPPVSLQVIGALESEVDLIGFGRSLEQAGISGFAVAHRNSSTAGGR